MVEVGFREAVADWMAKLYFFRMRKSPHRSVRIDMSLGNDRPRMFTIIVRMTNKTAINGAVKLKREGVKEFKYAASGG